MDTVRTEIPDLKVGDCYRLQWADQWIEVTSIEDKVFWAKQYYENSDSINDYKWDYTMEGWWPCDLKNPSYGRHLAYPFQKCNKDGTISGPYSTVNENNLWTL